MLIIRFVGRILPLSIEASFPDTPRTNWGSDDLGFPIIMTARINVSKVEVICEVQRFEEAHISVLLGRAYNLVDAYVNAAAFSTGVGMLTDIYAVDLGDHQLKSISREHTELPALCTAYRVPAITPDDQKDFAEAVQLILAEPNLLGSMSDLAETLMQFHIIPTNCGRVIDSLRRTVAPNLDRKTGFKRLQEIVHADSDYTEWISKYSTDPRHGDRETDIPRFITNEIRMRTWNVMNRILEYRKSGNQPLDEVKFPRLVHDPSFPFPTP
jgi:hypothetical protein